MFRQIVNWRTLLAFIAILIVSGTILYSSYLAKKIEKEEKQKVEAWVEASNYLLNPLNTGDIRLPFKIIQDNDDIPIIETNEKDSITNYQNLDSSRIKNDKDYLPKTLKRFASQNAPIVWIDPLDSTRINRYYYGHSALLKEVRYYPLVQLFIVGLFILITILALQSSYRSVQNQVWAGMAKETAHQLGTPLSSLMAWYEYLKASPTFQNEPIVEELGKDVRRLEIITERFSNIGSVPTLRDENILRVTENAISYLQNRVSKKVDFSVKADLPADTPAKVNIPLFEWVIENICKNAIDAMEGKGSIDVRLSFAGKNKNNVAIDIKDTGKGIPKSKLKDVFLPGYTTKKRGWGLGLALAKRIIENYHQGKLYVKWSELGKGTMFRVMLNR